MMSPYVQNVTKWIEHYNPKTAHDSNVTPYTDTSYNGNNIGLGQQGHMNVAKVEAKAPAPPVPSTGTTSALRTVSSAQAAVQQAAFDAKRKEIEKDESNAQSRKSNKVMKTKKTKKSSPKHNGKIKGTGKKKVSGKLLLGSPADIFKSKTLKKK